MLYYQAFKVALTLPATSGVSFLKGERLYAVKYGDAEVLRRFPG